MKSEKTNEARMTMPPRKWEPGSTTSNADSAALALAPPGKRGKTIVADTVIGTIARIAAEQIEGIHHVGAAGLRGVVQRFGSHGVTAEVGMKEAAVSLDIVIMYGYQIREIASELRQRVLDAVSVMANRKIVAVDVNVVGVSVGKTEPLPSRELA